MKRQGLVEREKGTDCKASLSKARACCEEGLAA